MEPWSDWDDVRFFLAVAREGSISGAARKLSVNHATVSRRIAGFEKRVGTRLFERLAGGWVPTPAGDEMLAAALRVEEELQTLDRRITGRDAQLSGTLRVTLSDAAAFALMTELGEFSRAHPSVELELAASNALTNLTRREADVAIRVTERPAEHLFGRRMGATAIALYRAAGDTASDRRDARGDAAAFVDLAWLGWDEGVGEFAGSRWMRENLPGGRVVARFDSVLVAYHAVRAGLGVCFLPCAVGDRDGALRRVDPALVLAGTPIWLLTHPDLRHTARVRTFLDFMAAAMERSRALREGRTPLPIA